MYHYRLTPCTPPYPTTTKKEARLDSSSSKLKTSWSKTVHSVVPMSVGIAGVYTSPSSEGTRLQHALADVAAVASRSPVKSTLALNGVCLFVCVCMCVRVCVFACCLLI